MAPGVTRADEMAIDRICEQFECACREGEPSQLDQLVEMTSLAKQARSQLVCELLGIELELAWQKILPGSAEHRWEPRETPLQILLQRYKSCHRLMITQRCDLARDEFMLAQQLANRWHLDDYVRRFPNLPMAAELQAAVHAVYPSALSVTREGECVYMTEVHGKILLGRQSAGEPTPLATVSSSTPNKIKKVVIAHRRDSTIPRRFLVIRPVAVDRIRITNVSASLAVTVNRSCQLLPADSVVIAHPIEIELGSILCQVASATAVVASK